MFCIFSICSLFHVLIQHIKVSREFFTIHKTSLRFWRVLLFKEVLHMHLCFPFPKVNKLPVLLEYGFQYDSSLNCKSKIGKADLFLPKQLTASFFSVWNTQTQKKKIKSRILKFMEIFIDLRWKMSGPKVIMTDTTNHLQFYLKKYPRIAHNINKVREQKQSLLSEVDTWLI